MILVAFDFDTNTTPTSVTDSQGNTFTQVGNQLTSPGGAAAGSIMRRRSRAAPIRSQSIYPRTPPGLNCIWPNTPGVDQVNPLTPRRAHPVMLEQFERNAATTVAGDVIFGYCVGDFACTAGSGFAARSTFNHNLIEDMLAAALARMPPKVRRTTVGTCRWSHSSLRHQSDNACDHEPERGERDSRQFILVPDRGH